MNKFAVISDLHSNLEALTAVFAEIDRRGIKEVFCLGDMVGYGPNPIECLDMIIDRQVITIMGNHDQAAFYEPTNFNAGAERAAYWVRQCLEEDTNKEKRNRRWAFLGRLPIKLQVGNMLMVHGSPRKPVTEYIFPEDAYNNSTKLVSIFERIDHLCFVGHTHVPGVFFDDPDFYPCDEIEYEYFIREDEKAIINVGSVGQSRDQDTRASFVIVEDNKVEFVRIEYDLEKTVEKILKNPFLDNFEGLRLREGR